MLEIILLTIPLVFFLYFLRTYEQTTVDGFLNSVSIIVPIILISKYFVTLNDMNNSQFIANTIILISTFIYLGYRIKGSYFFYVLAYYIADKFTR